MITSNGMAHLEYAYNENFYDEYDYENINDDYNEDEDDYETDRNESSSSNDCEIVPGPSKKLKVVS